MKVSVTLTDESCAEKEPMVEHQIDLETKIEELQKELGEVRKIVDCLEENNKDAWSSAMDYRMRWINEERQAMALELFGPYDAPCMSQAEWSASSPDRSYGVFWLSGRTMDLELT